MKLSFFLATFLITFLSNGFSQESFTKDDLTCRFISKNDDQKFELAGIKLPESWWSRPHEYAWAAKFVDKNSIVLDAACGIDHPFKWYLSENTKETWVCDIDNRILDFKYLVHQYGEETFKMLKDRILSWEQIHFVSCSICYLPSYMPTFDRIFCISTIEHLKPEDTQKALIEFSKKLSKDGLIIITIDYPAANPKDILQMADIAGLIPAKEVDFRGPYSTDLNGTPYYPNLYIYRIVLKHKFL